MSKIIFVNRFYCPDQSATSQLLTDLTTKLDFDSNVEIVVITSRRVMSDPNICLNAEDIVDGVNVKRVYTTNFGKKVLIGRLLDFFFFYITSFFMLLRIANKNDVVVVKTDPPLISVTSSIAVRLKGAKQINWLQDIYPEVACRLGVKGFNGFLGKLLINIRNYTLRKALFNVVLGDVMFSHVESLGIDSNKIKIIHNWSDGEIIKPIDKESNHLIKEWNLDNKFVVCYSGNMGRAHEFDTILDAIENLVSNKDIVFLFIGDGAKKQWLVEQSELRNLNNMMFMPYQDFSQLSYSLSVGDVHLISLISELEGLIVPSKFYGVMAAGRPSFFIGSEKSEIKNMLDECNCGQSFLIGEAEKLSREIESLSYAKESNAEMCRRARLSYLEKYDKSVAICKWQELLSKALN